MSSYTWTVTTAGASGFWNTPGNWKASGSPAVPGSATPDVDQVTLVSALGQPVYTVTVDSGKAFDISKISISGATGAGGTNLSVLGTLNTSTLSFTGSANHANVDIGLGGTLDVRTALTATVTETVKIEANGAGGVGSGGHLTFGSGTNSFASIPLPSSVVTFSFNNNGVNSLNTGVIEFNGPSFTFGSKSQFTIANAQWGDQFIIDNADLTGDTFSYSSGTLLVQQAGVTEFEMDNLSGTGLTSASFVLVGNHTIMVVCYARGTMIQTPAGEVPVEQLRPGRRVITLVRGEQVPQTVKWLGHRRIDLTTHPRPETVAPIRISRGAFAEAVPHRDLLVSPDHAILVDGNLICARQLINGTTIQQETGLTAVDYYHVELDQHAILLAEGLPAETYLDTGNSGFFDNSGAPTVLYPDLTDERSYPSREAGSCAPFVWDEASVRPVWQRLADRATVLGMAAPRLSTTTDAGLCVLAKGRTIKAIYNDDGLAIFVLPRGVHEARLLSRAASPTEARPWLEDRRRLGVRVSRLVLRDADGIREVPVDHPDLDQGWWSVERDGIAMSRWTNGEAVLPLPQMRGEVMLEVHLAGAMTYVADLASGEQAKRQAA